MNNKLNISFNFRSLLIIYSIIWLLFLLIIQFVVFPGIAHTYFHKVKDYGTVLPLITTNFGIHVLGPDPFAIDGEKANPIRYVIWLLIYLTALLPIYFIWRKTDDNVARWFWIYSSIGHGLFFIIIMFLTMASLIAPFMIL